MPLQGHEVKGQGHRALHPTTSQSSYMNCVIIDKLVIIQFPNLVEMLLL